MKRAARSEPDVRVAALVNTPLTTAGARRLAQAVLAAERAPLVALSLTFVSPAKMRALNRAHLGRDYTTDVIAFAMMGAGDVYICPAAARANAKANGERPKHELRRLVVHGTLHALGYEHEEGEARTTGAMWRRQERYLKKFGALAR